MGQKEKLPVRREDLYQFHFLSQPIFSPDGQRAAYVVNQVNKEKNSYDSSIWTIHMKTGENRMMAARGQAKSPLWLDAKTLLFASDRDKQEGAERTDYYQLSVDGGEAGYRMTIPVKVEGLRRLEQGWLVKATADEKERERREEACEETYEAIEGKDYDIYEELPFWVNGKGIRSGKRSALFLFDEEKNHLVRITPKGMEVTSFDVSPDGRRIAYGGPIYHSVMSEYGGLYLYDTTTGERKTLVTGGIYETGQICFMGRDQIFYTGTVHDSTGRNPAYYIFDLAAGISRQLPFCDASIGNRVGSDAKFGTGKAVCYCEKQNRLYVLQTHWGDCRLMAIDTEGCVTPISKEPGAITGFDVYGDTVVMTAMRGQWPAELYLLDPDNGREEKLTGFHDSYVSDHLLSAPESISYDSKNGYRMEGYVIRPANYIEGRKYPAVLEIHGGPKTASGTVFFHEYQCLANDGYFVFYCNPRGSEGRGQAYADIAEALGKDDFDDLMEFTDQVLAHYYDIDPHRTGICGGSYGGFMCNWIAGHTNRYRAAVSQRSISDYLTKMLYTDTGYYGNYRQMGAYPWEDFEKIWSMSPLSSGAEVKTPLLLLQSDEDYRCWMGEAIQMFSAVKRQGTDVRLVLFHGENHELSRSGKPENRMTRLKELEAWFETYLQ